MRVLVADQFEQWALDELTSLGLDVVYDASLSGGALQAAIAREAPAVLVVRGRPVTAAMMDQPALRLLVRAGAGMNAIDVDAAKARGITVVNTPGLNAIAVAELTIGLIVALDRRIPENVAELRAGRWNKTEFAKARGLHGRTLGLLGFGFIGQEVARRARAFDMRVLTWSRRFERNAAAAGEAAQVGVEVAGSPHELAARSSVFSVHLALTPDTRGMVNRALLERLEPGALFVNTARAEVVDSAALADAVRSRGLRVALDVYEHEPHDGVAAYREPLLDLPGVIGTHHIGASTDQAQAAIAQEVVRIIRDWSTHEHHNPHL